MRRTNFDGIGKITGGEYEKLDVDGVYTCEGEIVAQELSVDGVFNSDSGITADTFDCDGVVNLKGSVKAKRIEVDGVLSISNGKLESTHVFCDGVVEVEREVSADTIEASGFISAAEILGDQVKIKSKRGFLMDTFKIKRKWSTIKLLEATTIELEGTRAETVNGQNITIGPRCKIEHVDCTGTLSIHPSSTVEEITGEYTIVS